MRKIKPLFFRSIAERDGFVPERDIERGGERFRDNLDEGKP